MAYWQRLNCGLGYKAAKIEAQLLVSPGQSGPAPSRRRWKQASLDASGRGPGSPDALRCREDGKKAGSKRVGLGCILVGNEGEAHHVTPQNAVLMRQLQPEPYQAASRRVMGLPSLFAWAIMPHRLDSTSAPHGTLWGSTTTAARDCERPHGAFMKGSSVGALQRGQRAIRAVTRRVLHAMQDCMQDPGPLKFRK